MASLERLLALNDKSPLRDTRFCLGIGAQRSGTTWLGRYLERHPDFLMAPIKEMHVFDSICFGEARHRNIESRFSTALASRIPGQPKGRLGKQRAHVFALADRVAMMNIDGGYFKFFEKRYKKRHRSFGEITPEYALLESDRYCQIHKSFPDTRFFYILRDPVARYLSAINYWARLRPKFDVEDAYEGGLERNIFTSYTLYHQTIRRLCDAIPRDHIQILFYEEVFEEPDEYLANFCKTINIDYVSPRSLGLPVDSRVNSVAKSLECRMPSTAELQKIYNRFQEVYEELPLLLGRPLPDSWQTIESTL